MGLPRIESARLALRPFQEEDVDPLFAIMGNREAMQHTYIAPSREACAHRLRTYAQLESTEGFAPWTVLLRSEAKVIGWGGLNIDPFDSGWGIEISYCFDPCYWGKGYATELVRAAVQHGFDTLALPQIGAFAHPHNVASIRVLEKCGFVSVRYVPQLDRNYYMIERSVVSTS